MKREWFRRCGVQPPEVELPLRERGGFAATASARDEGAVVVPPPVRVERKRIRACPEGPQSAPTTTVPPPRPGVKRHFRCASRQTEGRQSAAPRPRKKPNAAEALPRHPASPAQLCASAPTGSRGGDTTAAPCGKGTSDPQAQSGLGERRRGCVRRAAVRSRPKLSRSSAVVSSDTMVVLKVERGTVHPPFAAPLRFKFHACHLSG
jgi:hypothetical protein